MWIMHTWWLLRTKTQVFCRCSHCSNHWAISPTSLGGVIPALGRCKVRKIKVILSYVENLKLTWNAWNPARQFCICEFNVISKSAFLQIILCCQIAIGVCVCCLFGLVFLFVCWWLVFQDRVPLCNIPSCLEIWPIDQAGLKDQPTSASRVLRLKVCTTTHIWFFLLLF